MSFSRVIPKLLTWYQQEKRELPWRETLNPYYIWISEIVLQQTRVNQGLPYYYKFVDKFPKIHDLANAHEEEVLKIWQGLGYYSRARNMQKAAKMIVNEFKNVFPNSFNEIKKLPGVGDYTAAAVASFAFKEPVPVVDGNVKRVFARFLGIHDNIQLGSFQSQLFAHLKDVIPANDPANFNQAMMELGALVCVPKNPKCEVCPIADFCIARSENLQNVLPINIKKTKIRQRTIHYFFVTDLTQKCIIQKRSADSIWGGLYEFPNVDYEDLGFPREVIGEIISTNVVNFELPNKPVGIATHKLSHQNITAVLWVVKTSQLIERERFKLIDVSDLNNFPLHKLMLKFVDWLNIQN